VTRRREVGRARHRGSTLSLGVVVRESVLVDGTVGPGMRV
jgi:hypothetical protein